MAYIRNMISFILAFPLVRLAKTSKIARQFSKVGMGCHRHHGVRALSNGDHTSSPSNRPAEVLRINLQEQLEHISESGGIREHLLSQKR